MLDVGELCVGTNACNHMPAMLGLLPFHSCVVFVQRRGPSLAGYWPAFMYQGLKLFLRFPTNQGKQRSAERPLTEEAEELTQLLQQSHTAESHSEALSEVKLQDDSISVITFLTADQAGETEELALSSKQSHTEADGDSTVIKSLSANHAGETAELKLPDNLELSSSKDEVPLASHQILTTMLIPRAHHKTGGAQPSADAVETTPAEQFKFACYDQLNINECHAKHFERDSIKPFDRGKSNSEHINFRSLSVPVGADTGGDGDASDTSVTAASPTVSAGDDFDAAILPLCVPANADTGGVGDSADITVTAATIRTTDQPAIAQSGQQYEQDTITTTSTPDTKAVIDTMAMRMATLRKLRSLRLQRSRYRTAVQPNNSDSDGCHSDTDADISEAEAGITVTAETTKQPRRISERLRTKPKQLYA
jgi:hypothetical protein